MSDSNFEPPRAPLEDRGGEPRKKRPNLLAIIIGALTDLIATLFTGALMQAAFAMALGGPGMSLPDLVQMLRNSNAYMISASILGLMCSVLGGYVCARFANQNEYANGLAVGVLGIISGLLLGGGADSFDVITVLLALATIPAALLGAHLKMFRDKRGGKSA